MGVVDWSDTMRLVELGEEMGGAQRNVSGA